MIGLRWIIPVLSNVFRRFNIDKETCGINQPPQSLKLFNMVIFVGKNVRTVESAPVVFFNHGHVPKSKAAMFCIQKRICPDNPHRVNRYPYPIERGREANLDRVQFNVTALEGKEEEEADRNDAKQRKINSHSYHLVNRIRYTSEEVKGVLI